ncbi:MAG: aminotransferase class V-fold PLP-dependent enzyme [Prevotella sp.]|nr:aminotransferase class V-fold PLP-dependent enzyme [Prevotella sp.]
MKKQTQAIHSRFQTKDAYGSLAMPVYHTAAYEFDNATEMADAFCGKTDAPDYSRVTNPSVTYFENKVKAMCNAHGVIAVSSGMAAISNTLICLTAAGKNIVTSRHLFGNTYSLIAGTMMRFGVKPHLTDLTNLKEVENAIDNDTACIFMEIITNPQMEVADIAALADIAHKKGIPLVADTTMIPFTQFDAHSLGVDIEVVSSTKYLSGGATSIGGLVIDYGTTPNFTDRMRKELLMNLGAYMTPHVAYMQNLGLETLDARYKVQADNALRVAQALKDVKQIKRVNYIGLEDNPFYELSRRQFGKTSGAMLTIDLDSQEACFDFINRLQVVRRATNLFDNKTLAIHPASTIFGNFTPRQRQKMDVLDTTIRLSIGLEAAEDIIEDIVRSVEG